MKKQKLLQLLCLFLSMSVYGQVEQGPSTTIHATFELSGKVTKNNGQAVANVVVECSSKDKMQRTMTDKNGQYAFHLPEGSYTLNFQKKVPLSQGVSTYDIILVQKLAIKAETADPFTQIAADVTRDQVISSRDYVELRKWVYDAVNKDDQLLFFPPSFAAFEYEQGQSKETLEAHFMVQLSQNTKRDVVAVKRGDVDHSGDWHGVRANSSEWSKTRPFILSLEDRKLSAGEETIVRFHSVEHSEILGFVNRISFNGAVVVGADSELDDVLFSIGGSVYDHFASWIEMEPGKSTFHAGQPLFGFKITAERDGMLSDMIGFGDKSDVYYTDGSTGRIELRFSPPKK